MTFKTTRRFPGNYQIPFLPISELLEVMVNGRVSYLIFYVPLGLMKRYSGGFLISVCQKLTLNA